MIECVDSVPDNEIEKTLKKDVAVKSPGSNAENDL